MEETLGERTENAGIRSPVVVEKAATKKKVRVVKKIVKKKIIKKVLKRASVASNCNDLERVESSNCNVNSHVEIEKPNVDIGGLKEVSNVKELEVSDIKSDSHVEFEKPNVEIEDLKEVENVKELEVSDMEECVNLVGTSDSCRDERQISGLVTSSLLGDQIHNELQGSFLDQTEMQDSDLNRIELEDNEQNRMGLLDNDQNQMELQDDDDDHNHIKLRDGDHNQIGSQDGDQNRIELQENDQSQTELQDGDGNQIEFLDRKHDTNTMDIEEHGGEGIGKELTANSETDGLKSQEALSEGKELCEKRIASRLHMKQMTKIFIHGLDQETKEEDIRKVFEEVGEVVEVKIVTNLKTGKKRGFGFIRFASADHANLVLTKYQNVEICGRPCHTAPIEGIDIILLNNIDRKWSNENVVELLQKIGIKKIDEVLVVPNADNTELNCGFAYLEFETKKDAQMAYLQLQNEIVSGKHSNLKVSWASPSVDPVEEENHNIKSVYAENIPLSWDEKEVKDHFKMFGEIESIALAKNLRTAKRNDFAFVNYKTCEAALSCIEALTSKKSTSNNGPMGHLKVSLTKSIPKVKPTNTISDSAVTEAPKAYQKAHKSRQSQNQYQKTFQSRQSQQNVPFLGVYKPPQKLKNMIGKHEGSRKDTESSTTAELVQLLREQAAWKQGGPSSTAGMGTVHHQPLYGGKQPFNELGSQPLYHHDPRAYHISHPRPVAMTSFPHYDQQRAHYTSGSYNVVKPDPRHFQIRDQNPYPGSSTTYRQMH